MDSLKELLSENSYPGRGIVVGRSGDGKYAITAYFIMGRSTNSRNRVFVNEGEGIRTEAFDPAKLSDPSLIIYAPVRVYEGEAAGENQGQGLYTVVTNGDQTDTVREGIEKGLSFEQALRSRKFEPDGPNFTPRISALMCVKDGDYEYKLSILKSDDGREEGSNRYTFAYENPEAGVGRFIHTYIGDGNPLPSFYGEPEKVELTGTIDELTEEIWSSLNEDNKVSLFVRYIDIETGKYESRIVNKNQ